MLEEDWNQIKKARNKIKSNIEFWYKQIYVSKQF